MTILAVETSGSAGGVAVVRDGRLVAETVCDITGSHVEKGVLLIRDVLERASMAIDGVGAVAVSLGPGSFTGLRAGMALAKGICMGRAIPLVGVPTLDCLAYAVRSWRGLIAPVMDARRGEIYFSAYKGRDGKLTRLTDYLALTPAMVIEQVKGLAGSDKVLLTGTGLLRYGSDMLSGLGSGVACAPSSLWSARPGIVGRLATEMLRRGETTDYVTAEPMYIRPSEAERSAPRKVRDNLVGNTADD